MPTARPELLALIRHAKDDLDDGVRRLVLADWLEEHGDVRADALRGRVPDRAPLAWFGPLADRGQAAVDPRGFTLWHAPGRALLSSADLVGSEALAWVATLRITSVSGTAVGRLVESGVLDEAESLDLSNTRIRTEGAAHLSRLRSEALRQLNLSNSHVDHAGVKRVARAAFAPRLRTLDLSAGTYWPETLDELALAPLTGLRTLRLGAPHLYDAAARLAPANWLGGLRVLSIRAAMLLSAGTGHLLHHGDLSSLEELDLTDNRLGRAFVAVLRAVELPALRALSLSENPHVADAVPELMEWPGLRRLQVLRLAAMRHTRAGLEALASSPHLDGLEALDVSGCGPVPALAARFGPRLVA